MSTTTIENLNEGESTGQPSALPSEPTTTPPVATATPAPTENQSEPAAFDPNSFEQTYGLPAGSLAGVTSESQAADKIRELVNQSLTAGLSTFSQPTAPAVPVPPPVQQPPQAPATKTVADMQREIDQLKSAVVQFTQASYQSQAAAYDERIQKEIDSWSAPEFGVKNTRSYDQLRKVQELRQLAATVVAGAQRTGQPVPEVEPLLRQVRKFMDPGSKAPPAGNGQPPLGTPSPGAKVAGDGKPKSLYEAYADTQERIQRQL